MHQYLFWVSCVQDFCLLSTSDRDWDARGWSDQPAVDQQKQNLLRIQTTFCVRAGHDLVPERSRGSRATAGRPELCRLLGPSVVPEACFQISSCRIEAWREGRGAKYILTSLSQLIEMPWGLECLRPGQSPG